jgi:hypothetical protein
MTPPEMAHHITEIARTAGVTIVPSTRGRAWRKRDRIAIPPIKSVKTYALALHELGHVLSPTQTGRRLDKEVDAWRWARAHAREWTPVMQAYAAQCLVGYVRWAVRRQAQDARGRIFIAPDHPVYGWVTPA